MNVKITLVDTVISNKEIYYSLTQIYTQAAPKPLQNNELLIFINFL